VETDPQGKQTAMIAVYPQMDEEGDIFTEMVLYFVIGGSWRGSIN
jgi:hypothetical protein